MTRGSARPGANENPAPRGPERLMTAVRRRILVVISDLVGAGAERETQNLLRYLPRDRIEPHLAVWRPVLEFAPPRDVPVHVLHKYRPWDVIGTLWRTARLVDELRPDLVFTQLPYVSLVTGLALGFSRWRPPWVLRLAGNPIVDVRFPLLGLARSVYRRAERLVGCSRGATEAAIRHFGVDEGRSLVLPNIVDVDDIRARARQAPARTRSEGVFTVAHAGRMVAQKNQALLLRAFARLAGRPAELWMMGKGPLEPSLRQLARELGVESQVHWLGFVENPFALFRQADCVALSSDHEGLPNVLIEALVAGTPVLSTDCPFGPAELVEPGLTGLLAPVGDERAFGDALEQWLADPALAARLRAGARALAVDRWEPRSVTERYAKLFLEVARAGDLVPVGV